MMLVSPFNINSMIQQTVCRYHKGKVSLDLGIVHDSHANGYVSKPNCWECFAANSQSQELADDLKNKTAIAETYLEYTLERFLDAYEKIKLQLV